jgi:predicted RNA binding protein YcfA (HicA-like mRNA interferase family)
MPRKIRDYKAELTSLGFVAAPRKGKGSHRVWKHRDLKDFIVIAYQDGEDVPLYLEKQLKTAKRVLGDLEQG